MRCKPCTRAFAALRQQRNLDKKLLSIYVKSLVHKFWRLRSSGVKSQSARPGKLCSWMRKYMNTSSNKRNAKRISQEVLSGEPSPKKHMAEHRKSASHDYDTGDAIDDVHMPAIAQEHIPCQLALCNHSPKKFFSDEV